MTSLDKLLFIAGIVLAIVCALFATDQIVNIGSSRISSLAPNIVAAAAVLGFGIASGLSFLGAAIAYRKHQKEKNHDT